MALLGAAGFAVLAAAGALVRWRATARLGGSGLLLVNVCGSFGLGLLAASSGALVTAAGVGGFGALTTVSGLAPVVAALWSRSRVQAVLFVALQLACSVAAASAGLALAEAYWR